MFSSCGQVFNSSEIKSFSFTGLSVDGDLQGVERLDGALSAYMWPGMVLKSGDKINEPSLPEKQGSISYFHFLNCKNCFLCSRGAEYLASLLRDVR